MADIHNDEQTSTDLVAVSDVQSCKVEALVVGPTRPWGDGSAPSLPSVDVVDDIVGLRPLPDGNVITDHPHTDKNSA